MTILMKVSQESEPPLVRPVALSSNEHDGVTYRQRVAYVVDRLSVLVIQGATVVSSILIGK